MCLASANFGPGTSKYGPRQSAAHRIPPPTTQTVPFGSTVGDGSGLTAVHSTSPPPGPKIGVQGPYAVGAECPRTGWPLHPAAAEQLKDDGHAGTPPGHGTGHEALVAPMVNIRKVPEDGNRP